MPPRACFNWTVPLDRSLKRSEKSSAELATDRIDCSWQVYHFYCFPSAYQDCLILLKYQRPLKMCLKLDANFLSLLANSKNLLQNICQYIYSQTKATMYYLNAGVILNAIKRPVLITVFRYKMAFLESIISSTRHLKPFILSLSTKGLFRQSGHVSWLAVPMAAETRQWVAPVWNSWNRKSRPGRSDTSDLGTNICSCSLSFPVGFCSAKTKIVWKSLSVDFRFFFPTGKTWSYLRC